MLDLRQAYLQLKLEEESSKYVLISTHKGLFLLPYGIFSAPWIFQKASCCSAQVSVYIDDILIATETEVLKCLAKSELRVKRHKCQFMVLSRLCH